MRTICPTCERSLYEDDPVQTYSCGDRVVLRENAYPIWIVLGWIPRQREGKEYSLCREDDYEIMKSVKLKKMF